MVKKPRFFLFHLFKTDADAIVASARKRGHPDDFSANGFGECFITVRKSKTDTDDIPLSIDFPAGANPDSMRGDISDQGSELRLLALNGQTDDGSDWRSLMFPSISHKSPETGKQDALSKN